MRLAVHAFQRRQHHRPPSQRTRGWGSLVVDVSTRSKACDLFLEVMEQVRRRYRFVVVGYVVMPEHVHLLFSEPERGAVDPRQSWEWTTPLTEGHVWQHRFYDFVVFTDKKRVEKLRYMHRNPVVRGLALKPG